MENMVKSHFWRDRRVFVTGASGLIGGWLTQSLVAKGADVVILLRDWVPNANLILSKTLEKTTVVRGDLSDPKPLERVLAEYEIQSVFHLAAQTIVPIANKNPLSTFESNIAGTWNLLEACRHVQGIESIVIASSDKAYGDVEKLPYSETMPLNAIYPYDVSKACADMLGQCYAKTFDLPVGITRCGNFFSGGDLNWNRLVPGTIRAVMRQESPIIRSSGQLIRDYIYIEDAVDAYMQLSAALTSDKTLRGEAFNFSNESQKTVLDLTQMILDSLGSKVEPVIQGNNQGEIINQCLSATKAKTLLNWKPKIGIEEGIKRTICWYENYFASQKV